MLFETELLNLKNQNDFKAFENTFRLKYIENLMLSLKNLALKSQDKTLQATAQKLNTHTKEFVQFLIQHKFNIKIDLNNNEEITSAFLLKSENFGILFNHLEGKLIENAETRLLFSGIKEQFKFLLLNPNFDINQNDNNDFYFQSYLKKCELAFLIESLQNEDYQKPLNILISFISTRSNQNFLNDDTLNNLPHLIAEKIKNHSKIKENLYNAINDKIKSDSELKLLTNITKNLFGTVDFNKFPYSPTLMNQLSHEASEKIASLKVKIGEKKKQLAKEYRNSFLRHYFYPNSKIASLNIEISHLQENLQLQRNHLKSLPINSLPAQWAKDKNNPIARKRLLNIFQAHPQFVLNAIKAGNWGYTKILGDASQFKQENVLKMFNQSQVSQLEAKVISYLKKAKSGFNLFGFRISANGIFTPQNIATLQSIQNAIKQTYILGISGDSTSHIRNRLNEANTSTHENNPNTSKTTVKITQESLVIQKDKPTAVVDYSEYVFPMLTDEELDIIRQQDKENERIEKENMEYKLEKNEIEERERQQEQGRKERLFQENLHEIEKLRAKKLNQEINNSDYKIEKETIGYQPVQLKK